MDFVLQRSFLRSTAKNRNFAKLIYPQTARQNLTILLCLK